MYLFVCTLIFGICHTENEIENENQFNCCILGTSLHPPSHSALFLSLSLTFQNARVHSHQAQLQQPCFHLFASMYIHCCRLPNGRACVPMRAYVCVRNSHVFDMPFQLKIYLYLYSLHLLVLNFHFAELSRENK